MKIYNDTDRFTIDWTLNSLCTYHCSYCPESLHRGQNFIKSKEQDPEIIKNFLENIAAQTRGRSVHLFLNGGEPTISPVFEQIIDFAHEHDWCAYVNTNGSRSLEWWQDYAHKIYKVTISYHPETVVDSELFPKIDYIRSKTNVGVFTLMYPPLWDKALNAYNYFKDLAITIAPSRVFKRADNSRASSYEYTAEQLAWLDDNSVTIFDQTSNFPPPKGNYFGTTYFEQNGLVEKLDEVEFTNKRKNKFTGWTCNMGIDHITIDSQGLVKTSTCPQSKALGTLENFQSLEKTGTTCFTEYCMCTQDVMITKYL
jgi:MoaA/NifB/PqqE/SkfB family radical SAM enzyme